MKTQYTLRLLALVLVSTLLTGCLNDLFEQDSQVYEGEPQLEFFPQTETYDEDAGTVEVLVQLIGAQRSSDTQVSFSVDAGATNAVAGTHYTLLSSSPVTLSANTSSVAISIELNGTTLTAGDTRTLVLTLDDNNTIRPAPNLKSSTITIEGT